MEPMGIYGIYDRDTRSFRSVFLAENKTVAEKQLKAAFYKKMPMRHEVEGLELMFMGPAEPKPTLSKFEDLLEQAEKQMKHNIVT